MVTMRMLLCVALVSLVGAVQFEQGKGKPQAHSIRWIRPNKFIPKINDAVAAGPAAPIPQSQLASYNFAVDFATSVSTSTVSCLKNAGYKAAFVQIYTPYNGGQVNSAGCQNIINCNTNGLGAEVYQTPNPTSAKTGLQQFDEAYNAMKTAGINVRTLWLQVTSPINWNNNVQSNVNFISSWVNRAQQYGVTPGIYTNWYDWQQITGAYVGFANVARLWYWNALGQGPSAEGIATFDDFRPFGGWNAPSAKQFALNEALCGLTLNRDVFPVGGRAKDVPVARAPAVSVQQDAKAVFAGGFV